ncbi:MAG: hypothetical protein AAF960_28700 [Bacteroidota bacterium]
MRKFLLILLSLSSLNIYAQDIRLENASFEDEPQDATMPQRWHSCQQGSTPDILPGFWGVYNEPYDGETYVGLITRPDGSFEAIGQRLTSPMKGKECYKFTVQLAHSNSYVNYNIPIRLRIYGGTALGERSQLLCESEAIKHTNWKKYSFQVFPKEDYPYIIIEAYFAEGIFTPYPGNVLIDDFSVFKRCPRA